MGVKKARGELRTVKRLMAKKHGPSRYRTANFLEFRYFPNKRHKVDALDFLQHLYHANILKGLERAEGVSSPRLTGVIVVPHQQHHFTLRKRKKMAPKGQNLTPNQGERVKQVPQDDYSVVSFGQLVKLLNKKLAVIEPLDLQVRVTND